MTYFMSSFPQKETPMYESLPCPECGALRMTQTVENYRLEKGLTVKRRRHFKCPLCGVRFFDDDAVRRIQAKRRKQGVARVV